MDGEDGARGAAQLAPKLERDNGQTYVDHSVGKDRLDVRVVASPADMKRVVEEQERRQKEEIENRAQAAMAAAKERGLNLPPVMENVAAKNEQGVKEEEDAAQNPAESEVDKGLFDGW